MNNTIANMNDDQAIAALRRRHAVERCLFDAGYRLDTSGPEYLVSSGGKIQGDNGVIQMFVLEGIGTPQDVRDCVVQRFARN